MVGSICSCTVRVGPRSTIRKKTHQILPVIIDTRIISRITDTLQESRLAGVCTTDYKNTKMSISLATFECG